MIHFVDCINTLSLMEELPLTLVTNTKAKVALDHHTHEYQLFRLVNENYKYTKSGVFSISLQADNRMYLCFKSESGTKEYTLDIISERVVHWHRNFAFTTDYRLGDMFYFGITIIDITKEELHINWLIAKYAELFGRSPDISQEIKDLCTFKWAVVDVTKDTITVMNISIMGIYNRKTKAIEYKLFSFTDINNFTSIRTIRSGVEKQILELCGQVDALNH